MKQMVRVKSLRIITLDSCVNITDDGIKSLKVIAEQLQVLSLANCINISDNGLDVIGQLTSHLTIFNVNNCPNVTHNILMLFAKKNKLLTTLHAASCYITDDGMSELCNYLSAKSLTSLDISFCREITDYSILTLAQCCPSLNHLNICSLSRVTTRSLKSLVSKCWYLRTLICEDLFLLTDDTFYFDMEGDGRLQAEAAFMRQFIKLNFRDCVNITDDGIKQITNRCRQVESFILRGCDKITDITLSHFVYINPLEGPHAFTDSLKIIDISFCCGITANGIVSMLKCGTGIEELNISGIVSVTDDTINEICKLCPTIIRLFVSRCSFITDTALCHMVDYLWLDELDISYCNKITDESIEVLTAACNGIMKLHMRKLTRITNNAVTAIARNLYLLRELDIRECHKVTDIALSDLKHHQKFVKVYK